MCLAGIVPANESTRLTKSVVPVMMDGVCSPAYFQQMASVSLFTEPLSAMLGTRSMYEFKWLCSRRCAQKTPKTEKEHGIPSEEEQGSRHRFRGSRDRKANSLPWHSEVSHYVRLRQRSERVGGLGRAHPSPAPSCRDDIWASDTMSAGPSGWWAAGILSLCFGEPSSCFHLAEAQISQYNSLPEIGANFHIRASRGGRSRCRAGWWGAAEPPVHAMGVDGGSAPDSH